MTSSMLPLYLCRCGARGGSWEPHMPSGLLNGKSSSTLLSDSFISLSLLRIQYILLFSLFPPFSFLSSSISSPISDYYHNTRPPFYLIVAFPATISLPFFISSSVLLARLLLFTCFLTVSTTNSSPLFCIHLGNIVIHSFLGLPVANKNFYRGLLTRTNGQLKLITLSSRLSLSLSRRDFLRPLVALTRVLTLILRNPRLNLYIFQDCVSIYFPLLAIAK